MGWWPFGKRAKSIVRVIRAKFDSAQTTPENRRHWANADGLAADAAANPEVRRTLRNRARYEVANNSYARGIVLTLANDVIGTGPRLQMLLGTAEANQTLEREFAAWAKAVDLAGKLRTMRMARAQDGEAFAVLFSNEALDPPVQLDLRLIEADQVATPGMVQQKPGAVDGIVLDEFGNPLEYHVLKAHPGGGTAALGQEYDKVPADSMVHWFQADLAGFRRRLRAAARPLDLWVVVYIHQLGLPLGEHLGQCDVATLWTPKSEDLVHLPENLERLEAIAPPGVRKVLGCYMWDYGVQKPMPLAAFQEQYRQGRAWLAESRIDGMIFLASCICDLELDTVEWLRGELAEEACDGGCCACGA